MTTQRFHCPHRIGRDTSGHHNPVAIVNGKKGTDAIVIEAEAGQTVKLDAYKSFDPDCDKLSFFWMQQKGIGNTEVGMPESDNDLPTVNAGNDIPVNYK